MSSSQKFPARPDIEAQWAPLYIEPMMGSGERITVGMAAVNHQDAETSRVIRAEHIECLWGDMGKGLLSTVDMCVESLKEHLQSGTLSNWEPPLSGFYLGQPRQARGYSLTDILRAGMELTASLSALELGTEEEGIDVDRATETDDRWPDQVRKAVTAKTPRLDQYFNQSYRVIPDARPTPVSYMSDRLAVNLDKLLPGPNLSYFLMRAKAKLLNLRNIRDHHLPGQTYELILFRPQDKDPTYTSGQIANLKAALLELDEAGNKEELRIEPVYNAEEAAGRIIKAEEAA